MRPGTTGSPIMIDSFSTYNALQYRRSPERKRYDMGMVSRHILSIMLLRLMGVSASLSLILLAQSSVTVVGIIEDASGAVVPSATVVVINERTGERVSVITDGEGRFTFLRLSVGHYRLSSSHPGFRQFVTEEMV